MPVIDVDPLVLKDVTMILGDPALGPDFKKHVDSVTFTPASAQVTWTGLGSNTHSDVTTATWTAAINHIQDWETEDSLSRFLYENEGETIPCTFKPRSGSGPSFTADLIITPGAIGGAVNVYAVTTVTLGCKAKPVLVPAV